MSNQTPSPGTVPAGWYPISAGSPQLRWWDGTQWTEHQYTVGSATGPQVGVPLRAPEGTKTGTVWIWIFAVLPLLQLAEVPFIATLYSRIFSADLHDPAAISRAEFAPGSGYFVVQAVGLFLYAIFVVFAFLDYRSLRVRGVPRPFHWAWTFLSALVYIIGRTVVARRRTGAGLGPLWLMLGAFVVDIAVTAAVVLPIIGAAFSSLVTSAG